MEKALFNRFLSILLVAAVFAAIADISYAESKVESAEPPSPALEQFYESVMLGLQQILALAHLKADFPTKKNVPSLQLAKSKRRDDSAKIRNPEAPATLQPAASASAEDVTSTLVARVNEEQSTLARVNQELGHFAASLAPNSNGEVETLFNSKSPSDRFFNE